MAETILNDATIGDLRALAKSYDIKADRTWKREDFIKAIVEAQDEGVLPTLATDEQNDEAERLIANYSLPVNRTNAAAATGAPKPGYARIILHKDPTPGHANSSVQVGLNGRMFNIPRGIAVDVPIPYLGVLRDAVHLVRKQVREPDAHNLEGVVEEVEHLSYPFQIVSLTPGGKFVNNEDQRSSSALRREAFHTRWQRWPTDGELIEWEKTLVSKGA